MTNNRNIDRQYVASVIEKAKAVNAYKEDYGVEPVPNMERLPTLERAEVNGKVLWVLSDRHGHLDSFNKLEYLFGEIAECTVSDMLFLLEHSTNIDDGSEPGTQHEFTSKTVLQVANEIVVHESIPHEVAVLNRGLMSVRSRASSLLQQSGKAFTPVDVTAYVVAANLVDIITAYAESQHPISQTDTQRLLRVILGFYVQQGELDEQAVMESLMRNWNTEDAQPACTQEEIDAALLEASNTESHQLILQSVQSSDASQIVCIAGKKHIPAAKESMTTDMADVEWKTVELP